MDIDLLDPIGSRASTTRCSVLREPRTRHPLARRARRPRVLGITRHDDLLEVNRDTEVFSSTPAALRSSPDLRRPAGAVQRDSIMLDMDPPKHTRYRLLVNKGFTPRMIGLLEDHLAEPHPDHRRQRCSRRAGATS